MSRSLTLVTAGLVFSSFSGVSEAWARTQRPPQSARVSDLWFEMASNGNKNERRLSHDKKGSTAFQRPTLRSRLAARRAEMAERRAAMVREQQLQMQMQMLRPVSPEAFAGSYEWPWSITAPPGATVRPGAPIPPRMEAVPPASREIGALNATNDAWFSKPNAGGLAAPRRDAGKQAEAGGKAKPEAHGAFGVSGSQGGAPKQEEKKAGGEFDHLPFAVPVPGKRGFVTLSGKRNNLPEIDVRGIASGTPVEVPDPDAPGATIQFRVP